MEKSFVKNLVGAVTVSSKVVEVKISYPLTFD
jgi:hypothetical protein